MNRISRLVTLPALIFLEADLRRIKFPQWFCLCVGLLLQPWVLAAPGSLQASLLAQTDPAASWAQLQASASVGASSSQELPRSASSFAWYRLQISPLPDEPLLVLRNTLGAQLSIRLADGHALSQRRGQWPISNPQYSQHNIVFDLAPLGDSVFLGVAKPPTQPILVGIYERADYLALDANAIRLLNTCLGILLAFAAMGFGFYLVERDRTALLFAAALLLQGFYFGFIYGEAAFWPGLGWLWPHWIEITVLAGILSLIIYCEVYARLIDLPQNMPRLMRAIRLLYIWGAAIILVTLIDWLSRTGERSVFAARMSFYGNHLIVIVSLLMFTGMFWSCMKRRRQATIVLLASLVSTAGHSLRASQFGFGWVSLEWAWSIQVLGTGIASSLMTIALMRRFMGLRDERDQARDLATHDPLTGALNRLGGMTIANTLFAQARQRARAFCVAVLDLDHFKQVNDRFGHPLGDAALKLFARLAQDTLAGDERLVRLGGEEFVLLLPGCDPQHALHKLNTLRLSVQRAGLEIEGAPVALTVSIGVANLRPDHTNVDALINDADQALYTAKRTGRNRAVIFDPHPSATGASTDELSNTA